MTKPSMESVQRCRDEGLDKVEIARALNCSVNDVIVVMAEMAAVELRARHEPLKRKRSNHLSAAESARRIERLIAVKAAIASGIRTSAEVAAATNLPRGVVSSILGAHGLTQVMEDADGPAIEKIRPLVRQGLSDAQIAEHLGMNRKAIGKIRRRAGLQANVVWSEARKARHTARCQAVYGTYQTAATEVGPPIDESLWQQALAGGCYDDHPRAAGPQAFMTLRRPEAISAPSNMAWSA